MLNSLKTTTILLSICFFLSCSTQEKKSDNKIVFKNNFDQLIGWTPLNSFIIKGDAHSGKYFYRMDTTTEFSFGFNEYLTRISEKTLQTVTFSAWCKMDQMPTEKINLVCSIEADGKSFSWSGVRLQDNIKKINEWTLISGMAKIPVNIPPNAVAKLYIFSPLKEVCYIDDMEISFE